MISSTRSLVLLSATLFSILSVACSSGDLAVGKSEQQLQTQKNGQPTGNGQTCSWQGTSQWDNAGPALPPEANDVHAIGDSFKSLDECNDCKCTTNGIMCTIRSCSTPPNAPTEPPNNVACTDDARQCPDGSFVGRSGPNCEFVCPGAVDPSKLGASCEADHFSCPAGQSCNSFSIGFFCAADPCAALTCPAGQQCQILESFPAQIRCGQ